MINQHKIGPADPLRTQSISDAPPADWTEALSRAARMLYGRDRARVQVTTGADTMLELDVEVFDGRVWTRVLHKSASGAGALDRLRRGAAHSLRGQLWQERKRAREINAVDGALSEMLPKAADSSDAVGDGEQAP